MPPWLAAADKVLEKRNVGATVELEEAPLLLAVTAESARVLTAVAESGVVAVVEKRRDVAAADIGNFDGVSDDSAATAGDMVAVAVVDDSIAVFSGWRRRTRRWRNLIGDSRVVVVVEGLVESSRAATRAVADAVLDRLRKSVIHA